jgi:hypothetical protein
MQELELVGNLNLIFDKKNCGRIRHITAASLQAGIVADLRCFVSFSTFV